MYLLVSYSIQRGGLQYRLWVLAWEKEGESPVELQLWLIIWFSYFLGANLQHGWKLI